MLVRGPQAHVVDCLPQKADCMEPKAAFGISLSQAFLSHREDGALLKEGKKMAVALTKGSQIQSSLESCDDCGRMLHGRWGRPEHGRWGRLLDGVGDMSRTAGGGSEHGRRDAVGLWPVRVVVVLLLL